MNYWLDKLFEEEFHNTVVHFLDKDDPSDENLFELLWAFFELSKHVVDHFNKGKKKCRVDENEGIMECLREGARVFNNRHNNKFNPNKQNSFNFFFCCMNGSLQRLRGKRVFLRRRLRRSLNENVHHGS